MGYVEQLRDENARYRLRGREVQLRPLARWPILGTFHSICRTWKAPTPWLPRSTRCSPVNRIWLVGDRSAKSVTTPRRRALRSILPHYYDNERDRTGPWLTSLS
jgi:hypothetical protein